MDNDFVRARLTSKQFSADGFEIRSVVGREAISRPFRFDLEIVCAPSDEMSESDVVGAEATLVLEDGDGGLREIHGMIAEIDDLLDTEAKFRTYRVALVPRLHRLSLVETQEIFMNTSVPDIVKAKLDLVGIAGQDVSFHLDATYAPREFVVEFAETDLAFVSRLTEHLGISYFFEHDDGTDKLVFTDHAGGFATLAGDDKVVFRARGERRNVYSIERRTRMFPATYVVQDYNYRTPQVDLTSTFETKHGHVGGVVEFGAHAKTVDEGNAIARCRAEERAARSRFLVGETTDWRFRAGARFHLVDHPRLGDVELLLVEVEHRLVQATNMDDAAAAENGYHATFRAVDATTNYRPPLVTPKPRIAGGLTAVVEAPPGDTPDKIARIDAMGRYLVRFVFDTASFTRPRASRPIRMLQPHAGPNYGMHFPLKPGTEVLVSFVGGDPDRPIIAGAIPNPLTPSPVTVANPEMHSIVTAHGIQIHMKDA